MARIRFDLIVEADVIPIPMESWCVTLVAVERARRDLTEVALEHYRSKELLIAHLIAEMRRDARAARTALDSPSGATHHVALAPKGVAAARPDWHAACL